ncbi:MAG: hypothetical protein GY870_16315 [archaeon]|nr:hypothetical protein [archaeon]
MRKKNVFYSLGIILLFLPASFVSGADSTATHAVLTQISSIETWNAYSPQLEISADGNYIYTASEYLNPNNYFYQFDNSETDWEYSRIVTHSERRTISGEDIYDIAVSDDGDTVLFVTNDGSTGDDHILYIDKENDLKWSHTVNDVRNVELTGDGQYYTYSFQSTDWYVAMLTIDGGGYFLKSFTDRPSAIQIADDASFVAIGFNNGTVQCYSASGVQIWSHDATTETFISEIDISRNGKYVIANGLQNAELYLYNSSTGQLLQNYTHSDWYTYLLGISSTGNEILVADTGDPARICLYGPDSSEPKWTIPCGVNKPYGGSISDDGKLAAVGLGSSRVVFCLIDCENGIILTNQTVISSGRISDGKISGDGSTAALVTWNGEVFIFEVVTGVPGNFFSGLFEPDSLIYMGIALGLGFLVATIIFKKKN